MSDNYTAHLADEELVLLMDAELPAETIQRAQVHFSTCEECRARFAKLENTLSEFRIAHRNGSDGRLPSLDSSRERLIARLQEARGKSVRRNEQRSVQPFQVKRIWAYAAGVALLAAIGIGIFHTGYRESEIADAKKISESLPVPDGKLTPGATIAATKVQVCRMAEEQQVQAVSLDVTRKVFQEYGMPNARPEDYEMDYLITPGLGGSGDIRNLWPEPYSSTIWNAKVKDELEDRLRQMVCAGQLELSTAQRDIATDWISAYKKYFHTDHPISDVTIPPSGHPRDPRT
jgi:hypothetical protein